MDNGIRVTGVQRAVLIVWFLFGLIGSAATEEELGVSAFLIFFFLPLLIGVIAVIIWSSINRASAIQADKDFQYYPDAGNLNLVARNENSAKYIKVETVYNTHMDYNPAELTYTGVSVGPVATGRFDYKPESYSVGSIKRTDRGRLIFTGGKTFPGDNRSLEIREITLGKDLIKSAKETPIVCDYLVGNKIILSKGVGMTDQTRFAVEATANQKKYHLAANALADAVVENSLTKAECKAIRAWICSTPWSTAPTDATPDTASDYAATSSTIASNLEQKQNSKMPIPSGYWNCSCGRRNPKYVSTCFCGKSKRDVKNN